MKGLAAILVENNRPLAIEEVEAPPPAYGQVLVRVLCSGLCGSQLGEISGAKGPDRYLPHLLGHEGTGTVLECGEGVTTVAVGDRVVMHWRPGAGVQSAAPQYDSALGKINAGYVTTFNEYAVVSENRVTRVPRDLDPEVGALMGCAVTTALGVVNNDASVRVGESIGVFGTGGIGLNVVQGAAMVSAYPIIAVDLHDSKLELAASLGATHLVNAAREDVEVAVRGIVGAGGLDVAIENTGNPHVVEVAWRLTGPQGRTILVGVMPNGETAAIHTLPLHFGKLMAGSHGGSARPDLDIPRYLKLLAAGKLNVKDVITDRYDLPDINKALDAMRQGRVRGRCILTASQDWEAT
jgi:S-(hydroxymethyl)glutathione dehydrogenase/alcohol dehydrogenase